MNLLLLKKFNNYYNRTIIKFDTYSEYSSLDESTLITSIDFNPNDGISTEQIINWNKSWTPDYLLVTEQVTSGGETTTNIISRWFVMECQRTRGKQYKLTLRRDVIADNMEDIKDSMCFIEKGHVNENDSAIFNSEDMTFNQIKTDEFLLKDETQCGWVVGYVAKGKDDGTEVEFEDATVTNVEASDGGVRETYSTIDDFYDAHPEFSMDMAILGSLSCSVELDIYGGEKANTYSAKDTGITCTKDIDGTVSYSMSKYNNRAYLHGHSAEEVYYGTNYVIWGGTMRQYLSESLLTNWNASVFNQIKDLLASKENVEFITSDDDSYKEFLSYVNSKPTIKIGNRFYKVTDSFTDTYTNFLYPSIGGTASELLYDNLNMTPQRPRRVNYDEITGNVGPKTFKVNFSYQRHSLKLVEIFATCTAKIPSGVSIPVLEDAPYHMFAIPFSDELTLYSGNNVHCQKTNKSVAISAAQALATQAGQGAIYDVQVLPFCPVRDAIITEFQTGWNLSDAGTYDTEVEYVDFTRYSYKVPKENHWYYLSKNTLDQTIRFRGFFNVKYFDGDETITSFDAMDITVNPSSSIKISHLFETILEIPFSEYVSGDAILALSIVDMMIITPGRSSVPAQHLYNLNDFGVDGAYVSKVDIKNIVTSDIIQEVEGGDDVILNSILWCTKSKFSLDIPLSDRYLSVMTDDGEVYSENTVPNTIKEHIAVGFDSNDIKVKSQTDMIRLASPNYSNFFDINVQKNKGIHYFNVDATYKPYQPYIHVNPDFNGLYGKDFDDIRGLICGGDFGIALTTDAWATYQLQNKNYLNIFDRETQALELSNSIQKSNEIVQAITGTLGGAMTGAMSGLLMGGPTGAAVGGAVGGVASAVGGIVDAVNNEKLRQEQMSLRQDRFGYQLENIQALPQGLAKTSALTNNNKIFPFIEYYTCTDEEKHALEYKIAYNGMTVMRIGTINEFLDDKETFIKGQMIRLDLGDDYHAAAVIGDEINKGVYL